MLHEQTLILRRLGAHTRKQGSIALVLSQRGGIGTDDAGPERAQELELEVLLRRGLADGDALQVEELPVDALEEGEEGGGIGQFAVDALFEDREEFVEGAVQGLMRALRGGGTEESGEGAAEGCG